MKRKRPELTPYERTPKKIRTIMGPTVDGWYYHTLGERIYVCLQSRTEILVASIPLAPILRQERISIQTRDKSGGRM